MVRLLQTANVRRAQRGFSMVELSIAILIALFLLGGLITLVMGTRRTNATQTALSQLQDNERIAMTVITNAVQKAGYFPDPVNQNLASFVDETFNSFDLAPSQVLGGVTTAGSDSLMVRFFAPAYDPNATVIDCAGQSNSAASSAPNSIWYTNSFQVATVGTTSWLQCQSRTSGTGTVLTVNLIPNVTQISVMYGISTSSASGDYSIQQYLTTSQMTAANWLNVTCVKVTLTFLVPAYGTTGGQMSATTTTFTRVIPIMSRAGVET